MFYQTVDIDLKNDMKNEILIFIIMKNKIGSTYASSRFFEINCQNKTMKSSLDHTHHFILRKGMSKLILNFSFLC